jgi:hypothetical protein
MSYSDVAITILDQLGGNRFRSMTGANSFCCEDEKLGRLVFRIPTKNGVNYINITLDFSDTYDMEFWSVRGSKKEPYITRKLVKQFSGIYCDQLQEIFTEVTGLRTSL